MEIKSNMYVRTKKYGIAKVVGGTNQSRFNIDIFKKDGMTLRTQSKKDIIKASYDIIDLIEEGDYVNGLKVTNIGIIFPITKSKIIYCRYELKGNIMTWGYSNKDIKSVVTKEQFENMKYEVQND